MPRTLPFPNDNLLIERNTHLCQECELFDTKFQDMFLNDDQKLFGSDIFKFKINDQVEIENKIALLKKVVKEYILPNE